MITSERNLSTIDSKEIVQIGFYQNKRKEIQVVRMPKTIERVFANNKIPHFVY